MENRLNERYYIKETDKYIYEHELMEIRFTDKEIVMYPYENDVLSFKHDEVIREKSTGLRDSIKTEEHPDGKLMYEGDVVKVMQVLQKEWFYSEDFTGVVSYRKRFCDCKCYVRQ